MTKTVKEILLVEDNPDDEALALRALKKHNIGNEVKVVRDGAEALEVLKRLREDERTREIPIVILTTSSEDRDRIEGYRLGANSYVRKPVDFNEFSEAVRTLGLYWLLLNEHPQSGGGSA